MNQIRYIQASDLHLDTPFQGLARSTGNSSLSRHLKEATFAALENLILLCERERPDFLLLAGDIYNQEERSIKAQLALCSACKRLEELGISVFMAHGNHDPVTSRLAAIDFPDNVISFGVEPEQHVIEKNGTVAAIIHGISHSRNKESRNLARMFRRNKQENCFQVGVLHCSVDSAPGYERYAPCSVEDLVATELDAWALGHVHEKRILHETPFIAYSGNTQGLHINEPGSRGCYVVTAQKSGESWLCNARFEVLGAIQWESLAINLDGIETITALENLINNNIERLRSSLDKTITGVITRLQLTGHTSLDSMLRNRASQEDLAEALAHFNSCHPAAWIKDFKVSSAPVSDKKDYLEREDLLGEATRVAEELKSDMSSLNEMAATVLEPLYEHARLRKVIQKPDEQLLQDILQRAERMCQDLLEGR